MILCVVVVVVCVWFVRFCELTVVWQEGAMVCAQRRGSGHARAEEGQRAGVFYL